jgi:hypothetical protein
MADGKAATALAFAPLAVVLADGGAAAALALASLAAVLTDRGTTAALASASYAVVLTDAQPPAFSASTLLPVVMLVPCQRDKPTPSACSASLQMHPMPLTVAMETPGSGDDAGSESGTSLRRCLCSLLSDNDKTTPSALVSTVLSSPRLQR